MPKFQKLDQAKVAELFDVLSEYREFLATVPAGQGGEIVLEEGDNKTTIKNRLTAAAKEMKIRLEFARTKDDMIRFRVVPSDEPAPVRKPRKKKTE